MRGSAQSGHPRTPDGQEGSPVSPGPPLIP